MAVNSNPEQRGSSLLNRRFKTGWLWRGAILIVILLAFYLRLRYLSLFQFHIDEFFTLAAADFIGQSGLPRYPTGLFYDPGLPYSYLSGGLFWLLGFNEAVGRWPALIFGVLAVVTLYGLGARLLRSNGLGLLAALWLALSLESVEWGGRARMITLAQWLALLSAGLLWLGLVRNSTSYRLAFVLSYGLSLLSHFATVVLMPAWLFAAGALYWCKSIRFQRVWMRDAVLLGFVFILANTSGAIFQPPPSLEFQTESLGLGAKVAALVGKFLQFPPDLGHAWQAYAPYFLETPHNFILILALVGLAVSLLRVSRRAPRPADPGVLFLGAIFLMTLLVLVLLINAHWQRSRYLLMQLQGFFLILGAHGFGEMISWLKELFQRRTNRFRDWPSFWPVSGAVTVGLLLSLPFLPPLEDIIEGGGTGWNRYDQAFGHVRANLNDDDKVMSMHPPASLLYLDQSDYYLVQSSPKLIVRPDGALVDRYSGAIWLNTAEEFSGLLAGPQKIWLVTQEFWLFNSYDGYLQQQILWQMDKLWGEGGVWALASRSNSWPLAKKAETILNAEFDGGARLLGYTAAPSRLSPGSTVQYTFFWQDHIPYGAKILLHLRDKANNTVAQADHFIYDGKVPSSRWSSLLSNDIAIRDGALLTLPPDLLPGSYRILIGFYHPETFERLGVVNDQSGESAVILGEWSIK